MARTHKRRKRRSVINKTVPDSKTSEFESEIVGGLFYAFFGRKYMIGKEMYTYIEKISKMSEEELKIENSKRIHPSGGYY